LEVTSIRCNFFTVLLPGIASFPSGYKQLIEFLGLFEIHVPAGVVANFVSEHVSTFGVRLLALSSFGYVLAIPITSFMAKRGLFLGTDARRICFPGEQGGCGVYSKEREILGSIGLHGREAPTDLWLLGVVFLFSQLFLLLTWQDPMMPWARSREHALSLFLTQEIIQGVLFVGLCVAALRRGRTGRA
jgi:hypothetical protein